MKKRPFYSKKIRKHSVGKCTICDESQVELLDVHRIIHGGSYSIRNTVVLCTCCHRKHHAGIIHVERWLDSTSGRILQYIDENGAEQLVQEPYSGI